MGGPDPGPLTTRSGRGGLHRPAGHPGRGPSGKGRLEDGRARPGAPDHSERLRSIWEAPTRGSLPPWPLLRHGDFPLRPSGRPASSIPRSNYY
ncbi:hypothetical protein NDU88_000750 [Pleurodeles waltl]|uniref:Uncharacterized protein n=1 Tax=Pleurodeles waltl TaxID=8319 RepID=A0AAV7U4C8_PLEWA|nr:hypothetical protein NDU88_000750 [Pleurodeles waltl]